MSKSVIITASLSVAMLFGALIFYFGYWQYRSLYAAQDQYKLLNSSIMATGDQKCAAARQIANEWLKLDNKSEFESSSSEASILCMKVDLDKQIGRY